MAMKFPQKFSGVDPDSWLSEMETFLYELEMPMEQWVELSLPFLMGSTESWVSLNALRIAEMNWCDFSYNLLWEFGNKEEGPTLPTKINQLGVEFLDPVKETNDTGCLEERTSYQSHDNLVLKEEEQVNKSNHSQQVFDFTLHRDLFSTISQVKSGYDGNAKRLRDPGRMLSLLAKLEVNPESSNFKNIIHRIPHVIPSLCEDGTCLFLLYMHYTLRYHSDRPQQTSFSVLSSWCFDPGIVVTSITMGQENSYAFNSLRKGTSLTGLYSSTILQQLYNSGVSLAVEDTGQGEIFVLFDLVCFGNFGIDFWGNSVEIQLAGSKVDWALINDFVHVVVKCSTAMFVAKLRGNNISLWYKATIQLFLHDSTVVVFTCGKRVLKTRVKSVIVHKVEDHHWKYKAESMTTLQHRNTSHCDESSISVCDGTLFEATLPEFIMLRKLATSLLVYKTFSIESSGHALKGLYWEVCISYGFTKVLSSRKVYHNVVFSVDTNGIAFIAKSIDTHICQRNQQFRVFCTFIEGPCTLHFMCLVDIILIRSSWNSLAVYVPMQLLTMGVTKTCKGFKMVVFKIKQTLLLRSLLGDIISEANRGTEEVCVSRWTGCLQVLGSLLETQSILPFIELATLLPVPDYWLLVAAHNISLVWVRGSGSVMSKSHGYDSSFLDMENKLLVTHYGGLRPSLSMSPSLSSGEVVVMSRKVLDDEERTSTATSIRVLYNDPNVHDIVFLESTLIQGPSIQVDQSSAGKILNLMDHSCLDSFFLGSVWKPPSRYDKWFDIAVDWRSYSGFTFENKNQWVLIPVVPGNLESRYVTEEHWFVNMVCIKPDSIFTMQSCCQLTIYGDGVVSNLHLVVVDSTSSNFLSVEVIVAYMVVGSTLQATVVLVLSSVHADFVFWQAGGNKDPLNVLSKMDDLIFVEISCAHAGVKKSLRYSISNELYTLQGCRGWYILGIMLFDPGIGGKNGCSTNNFLLLLSAISTYHRCADSSAEPYTSSSAIFNYEWVVDYGTLSYAGTVKPDVSHILTVRMMKFLKCTYATFSSAFLVPQDAVSTTLLCSLGTTMPHSAEQNSNSYIKTQEHAYGAIVLLATVYAQISQTSAHGSARIEFVQALAFRSDIFLIVEEILERVLASLTHFGTKRGATILKALPIQSLQSVGRIVLDEGSERSISVGNSSGQWVFLHGRMLINGATWVEFLLRIAWTSYVPASFVSPLMKPITVLNLNMVNAFPPAFDLRTSHCLRERDCHT